MTAPANRELPNGRGRPVQLWLAALALVILATLFLPLPPLGRRMRAVLDLVHAPAFALLAVIVASLTDSFRGKQRTLRFAMIWIALAATGVVTEHLQSYFGRKPSWSDAAADALGACAGLLFWMLPQSSSRLTGTSVFAAALLLLSIASLGPISEIIDDVRQQQALPLVASFEDRGELSRWEHTRAARIGLSSRHATHGHTSLRVTFGTERFSGVTMVWPPRDWRAYRTLKLDVTLAEHSPLDLVIKIYDREHRRRGFPHEDRFHRRARLRPGTQTITIDLDDVRRAPAERTMDLGNIDGIELFVVAPKRPRTIFLDDVRFEGARSD